MTYEIRKLVHRLALLHDRISTEATYALEPDEYAKVVAAYTALVNTLEDNFPIEACSALKQIVTDTSKPCYHYDKHDY